MSSKKKLIGTSSTRDMSNRREAPTRFTPRSDALPEYSGLYVATTLTYVMLGRTRFDWNVSRDVRYSFEETDPYYLETGTRLTVTQQLVGRFDVQGIGGRQRLEYRAGGARDIPRIDHLDVLGAGVGYRVRENLRFAINGEYARRENEMRTTGSGLGITFGAAMADALHRPIGLIPAAHGGTSEFRVRGRIARLAQEMARALARDLRDPPFRGMEAGAATAAVIARAMSSYTSVAVL